MSRHILLPLLISISGTLMLSGCATSQSGIDRGGDVSANECNPWIGAGVGAIIGTIIAGRKNTARGAVAGAAVGALGCIAINAATRQIRTADSIEQNYRRTNAGRLPPTPRVLAYDISIDPARPVPAGEIVMVRSNIAVVSGQSQAINDVREELILTDSNGQEFKRATKVVGKKGTGSGEYENQFSFKFPTGISQGFYGVKTALYVNGQKAGERANRMQLVVNRQGLIQLALLN